MEKNLNPVDKVISNQELESIKKKIMNIHRYLISINKISQEMLTS